MRPNNFTIYSHDLHTEVNKTVIQACGDARDLFPVVWQGFLYILGHP